MTTLSTAIMAHVHRRDRLDSLVELTHAEVSLDDGSLGENANGDAAWRLVDLSTDWGVVLQDDAVVKPWFLDQAVLALSNAETPIVSFYTGTSRPRADRVSNAVALADEYRRSWLSCETLLWGVGVALRTSHIPDMLRFVEEWDYSFKPYDERIGRWASTRGYPVWYTHPSLVDHADEETLVSHPIGAPTGARVAHRFGFPTAWNTRPVAIG